MIGVKTVRQIMSLYHIATRADWEAAQRLGSYQTDSLALEGFIHCSTRAQVLATANRFFRRQPELVLIVIAPPRLCSEVRYENLEGGEELFPHLYGPLNLEAVTAVYPFVPGADGSFSMPPGLD